MPDFKIFKNSAELKRNRCLIKYITEILAENLKPHWVRHWGMTILIELFKNSYFSQTAR